MIRYNAAMCACEKGRQTEVALELFQGMREGLQKGRRFSVTQSLSQADACFTKMSNVACAVMTADCLPILLCSEDGEEIAAIHAGWRGLVGDVIESTVKQFSSPVNNIMAWLGPAISQQHFEVGAEVKEQFLKSAGAEQQVPTDQAFVSNPLRKNHYFADLYQLAEIRIRSLGVRKIYGGEHCSFTQDADFFSYRRDGETGRMVTIIYKKNG